MSIKDYIFDPAANKIADTLLENKQFKNEALINLKNILKDNKIDYADVPYILSLVATLYNNYSTIHIKKSQIKDVFKIIILRLLDDVEILNKVNKDDLEKIIDSALSLLSMAINTETIMDKIKSKCCCCK